MAACCRRPRPHADRAPGQYLSLPAQECPYGPGKALSQLDRPAGHRRGLHGLGFRLVPEQGGGGERPFPGNLHLQRFLAAAYLERGDTEAAAKIARSMMSNVLDDWEIFWATSDSDFFSESRSTRIDLSRGNSLETTLHFDLPVDATTVRIDLPAKTHLRIHNLRLSIGKVRNEIVFKEVRLSQMRYERGTLVSYGGIDPYFVLPVKRIEQTDPNAKIAVTLQLQISTVILGYELSLSDLFDET